MSKTLNQILDEKRASCLYKGIWENDKIIEGIKEWLEQKLQKISCESFDGWVENSGENCDGFEEHVQLVRERDVKKILLEDLQK